MLKVGDKVAYLVLPLDVVGTVIDTRAGLVDPTIQVVRIELFRGGTLWYEAMGLVKMGSDKLECECNLCSK